MNLNKRFDLSTADDYHARRFHGGCRIDIARNRCSVTTLKHARGFYERTG
jgi:seryl-tRNA synthetase